VRQAGACIYSIYPTNQPFLASGGSDSVAVLTQSDCLWTASSNAPWITITSGSSGTGGGRVNYSVAFNTSISPRSGTLTIAGQSGSSGSGNGTVSYTVATNTSGNARTGTLTIGPRTFTVMQVGVNAVSSVSAASFLGAELASESIVAAFGTNLATAVAVATTLPLPTTLAGTIVKVRDSAGMERLAPLFFVAPSQVNCLVPPGTANGAATVTITSRVGAVSAGMIQVASVAPGLFAANANGQGVAAAVALRVKNNGTQSFEPVANFDAAQGRFVAAPIDLGLEGDQVFLVLYGAGLRNRSTLSAVTCKIGGVDTAVLFVGAAEGYVGLDQINIGPLPRSLNRNNKHLDRSNHGDHGASRGKAITIAIPVFPVPPVVEPVYQCCLV